MAGPAQALQVGVGVSAAMSLRFDVVNAGGGLHYPLLQMLLAQPFVPLQDPRADGLPFRAVAALVSCLAGFVLFPAFAFVRFTIA